MYSPATMRPPTSTLEIWKYILLSVGLLVSGSALDTNKLAQRPLNTNGNDSDLPVYLNNTEAYDMLAEANAHDFYAMQRGCDAQYNQIYCSPASAACILNSLLANGLEKQDIPLNAQYDPYHYAVDVELLDPPTDGNEDLQRCIDETVVLITDDFNGITSYPYGMNLDQAAAFMKCHLLIRANNETDFVVRAVHVDETVSVGDVRDDLIQALEDDESRVYANFHRSGMGQSGGGHFSPIVAYHNATDSFLVQDVAKYKFPPFFASAARLHASMHTVDSCGEWNFPSAQVGVDPEVLDVINNGNEEIASQELGCSPAYRGYIVVEGRADV